ncbi:agmatinase [Clostridia bacterium]|nr:agmatinase [Clostridia bacterium]
MLLTTKLFSDNAMIKNIPNFIGCDCDYDSSSIVIFGAPYDSTTSNKPGARFAPGAMRAESYGLETYSPYFAKDLSELSVYDAGELPLPFGTPEPALHMIEGMAEEIFTAGKVPVMLGGEHLVTLGSMRAAARHFPNLSILHFDAHADLRDEYLSQKLSHATVMRRCGELLSGGKLYQFGIRSGDKSEFLFADSPGYCGKMHQFDFAGLEETLSEIGNAPVYFTLDLDVLDPGVFPATGTPEAGGVSFNDIVNSFKLMRNLNIVGADITELSPPYDSSGASTALACKVLRELLLIL